MRDPQLSVGYAPIPATELQACHDEAANTSFDGVSEDAESDHLLALDGDLSNSFVSVSHLPSF